jgi:signal transduction histidine kinase
MGTAGCSEIAEVGVSGNGAEGVVLVVDDEEAMRDSCAQVLEREHLEVVAVPDGRAALQAMTGRRPDVVLVDLKMPGMSGEEFLVQARRFDPDVVAVVITGYPNLASAVNAMKAGAYDFLPKPFKADELRVIIGRALEKRRLALAVAEGEHERSRMHDNFVAMVAHQLKSPAATCKECLDVALAAYEGDIPGDCAELLQRAAGKAGLLLDLMNDWLTLSRFESGGVEIAAAAVDLARVVRDAVDAAREAPAHNEVNLEVRVPDAPVPVKGDAGALRELLVNLIDNAMRYTPDGGQVSVTLEHEGGCAVACVSDDGPGIRKREQEIIFEPFFRGDSAKQVQGTGLGLAIARRIVEAHGGRLTVESSPKKGSTFKVHLPHKEENV